jgi:hypothetical protein
VLAAHLLEHGHAVHVGQAQVEDTRSGAVAQAVEEGSAVRNSSCR